MAFKIQRVPRGLSDVLSIFGGQQPELLGDTVTPTLDLLQFYGLNQRITFSGSGVIAQGARISLSANDIPRWAVLYGFAGQVALTATLTAVGIALEVQRSAGATRTVYGAGHYEGPFGAGAIPGVFHHALVFPYPLLLPPGSLLSVLLTQLGTDANATVAFTMDVGLLG